MHLDLSWRCLTTSVLYDHTLLYACILPDQTSGPDQKWAVSLVSSDGRLIFLMGLCGYVLVNILTLSPLRATSKWQNHMKVRQAMTVYVTKPSSQQSVC